MALRFPAMRGNVALAAMAPMLTACSGNTSTSTAETEAVTTPSPTSTTTSSTSTPTLASGGWSETPPSRDAIEQMVEWAAVSISDVKTAVDESSKAIDGFEALQKSPDVTAAKAGCQDMTQPIDIKLGFHIPTPDSDLTNALQAIIDNAGNVGTSCENAITDPSTANKKTFGASVDKLRSSFTAAAQIMVRDGKILTAAGF
jgi:hypothetical protein